MTKKIRSAQKNGTNVVLVDKHLHVVILGGRMTALINLIIEEIEKKLGGVRVFYKQLTLRD